MYLVQTDKKPSWSQKHHISSELHNGLNSNVRKIYLKHEFFMVCKYRGYFILILISLYLA